MKGKLWTILAIFVVASVVLAIVPLINVALGYFSGWVLCKIFPFAGVWVVNGLSQFGIEITIGVLPKVGAALGFVGSFFRAIQKNENKS